MNIQLLALFHKFFKNYLTFKNVNIFVEWLLIITNRIINNEMYKSEVVMGVQREVFVNFV